MAKDLPMPTPCLPTGAAAPIIHFERHLVDQCAAIEHWFRMRWHAHQAPFYGSVDLRNAGFKLAPVDMNLFPGGFNNLAESALPCTVQAAQDAVERLCPQARNVLLIPEQHTRNVFYLSNVLRLVGVLRAAGLNVRVGSWSEDIKQPVVLAVAGTEGLTVEPVQRSGARIGLSDFDPDMVLLNNDLSAGIPNVLRGLSGQVLLPPLAAGWAVRRKSNYFAVYEEIAKDFGQLVGIDSWLVDPYFTRCSAVDFHAREGEACLTESVHALLTRLRAKYKALGIGSAPFVIVKADAGTYGMGIITVRDASEVRDLNRKQRNKMAVVKEGMAVSEVLIQEGVPTLETVGDGAAEPVVYMMDRHVIGGFYRVHTKRGPEENLNAPGMHFAPLPFASPCNVPGCTGLGEEEAVNRYYTYGVVARLALLASAIELERTGAALREGVV